MKFFTSVYNSIRKRLRLAGFLYIGLSVLSSIFYCSCTSGSFYSLSTGEYMLEQRLDRQFIITTECKYSPDNSQCSSIPVYQAGDKYYVAAERVTSHRNRRILASVGWEPDSTCVNQYAEGEKKYYEVEKSTSNGEISFTVPSGNKEDTMPIVVRVADKIPHSESTQTSVPTFTCRLDSRAAMPHLVSLPDDTPHTMAYLRGEPLFTKGKDGSRQLMLTGVHEDLSWRSIYAVPSAAVLFVAVDIPFDIISFTGFCIRRIFD